MRNLYDEMNEKPVDSIKWPFLKYMVLVPEKNEIDAFAWLYISFVRLYNKKKNADEFSYNEEIENIVKGKIRQEFGDIIDVPTLDKVIQTTKEKYLDPKGKTSIEVFKNLFSDRLQIRYIFRDCITGSVVPYFYDQLNLPAEVKEEGLSPVKKNKPDKKYVKLAYKRYLKRERYVTRDLDELIEEFEEEDSSEDFSVTDEDTQLYEDDDFYSDRANPFENQEQVSLPKNFDVKFVDDGCIVYFNVPIIVEDNRLSVRTPFDSSTGPWLNTCFDKGSKENSELKGIYKKLSIFLVPRQEEQAFFEDAEASIYSKLPHCGKIYRMVQDLGNDNLKRLVWTLENKYSRRDSDFYINCGKMLEMLLKLRMRSGGFEPSNSSFRLNTTEDMLRFLIDSKCVNIDCEAMLTPKNVMNWKNRRFNAKRNDLQFKPDFLDLMLQSDISKSTLMYHDFVNDVWNIYNLRNKQGHADSGGWVPVTQDSLETMERVVEVFCDNIQGNLNVSEENEEN